MTCPGMFCANPFKNFSACPCYVVLCYIHVLNLLAYKYINSNGWTDNLIGLLYPWSGIMYILLLKIYK